LSEESKKYQVLSRKYRPQQLSELVGQDMLVKTLTNAIDSDRIPHAFIMTGIRGVGKTSTARIIARSLICTGADGNIENPTTTPCGICENCKAIAEDRHVDVMEMDAASRTGVGDIREIIDNVHYLPVMARYKIYIIDEVHMLSKSAFNALLKTLEEPPAHAKFIFATTEIRKIPVTILSRCMRFDLPRIPVDLLIGHFGNIAKFENANVNKEALAAISCAAEGSVRDGLSLLDQAIGTSNSSEISVEDIRNMLGIADREKIFDLFDAVVSSEAQNAVEQLRSMYDEGADPVTILQDLLEITHFITQMKIIKGFEQSTHISEIELNRGKEIADKLTTPFLARLWQMLLKGVTEAKIAANNLIAAEMVLIRIAYSSDMPTPDDLIKKITSGDVGVSPSVVKSSAPAGATASAEIGQKKTFDVVDGSPLNPKSFSELVAIFDAKGESIKAAFLRDVKLISFDASAGRFEFSPNKSSPQNFAGEIGEMLSNWTGKRWIAILSNDKEGVSINEKKSKQLEEKKAIAINDKNVKAIVAAFPNSSITKITEIYDDVSADIDEVESDKIAKQEKI